MSQSANMRGMERSSGPRSFSGSAVRFMRMGTADFSACKVLLFDFGGTLDSDGEHWLDRFYELYEKAGLDIAREDIKRVFYRADELCCADPGVNALGLRPLMDHHVRLQFSMLGLENEEALRFMADDFCSRTESVLARNAGILRGLRDRFRMGVISNFYGNVAVLCREAGLSEHLDVILDSVQVGISKPDPDIFRMALEKLDRHPENTIFVGDSYERDVVPAQRMGMKAIWMKGPNPRLPENPAPPDGCISSLVELGALVS